MGYSNWQKVREHEVNCSWSNLRHVRKYIWKASQKWSSSSYQNALVLHCIDEPYEQSIFADDTYQQDDGTGTDDLG